MSARDFDFVPVLEPGEINHSESGRNSQLELTGNNHS